MEDRQFDALTKKLASPVSRRTVFRAAIASVAGGIGVMATLGKAQAQNTSACHGAGTPCTPSGHNNECCTGTCVDMGSSAGDRCGCPNGVPPCITTVGCPAGFSSCEVCPPTCTGGAVLNSGTCTCVCSGGATFCGGKCVPKCTDGEVFNQNTCTCVCPSGKVLCNGLNGGAGGCVPACTGGEILNQSTCVCACANGETFCGNPGFCTNTNDDPNNCGSCGNVCPNGEACFNGVCKCSEGPCGTAAVCCADGSSCCGTGDTATCCTNNRVCCGTGATATCCAAGSVCLTPATSPGPKIAGRQVPAGPSCCAAGKVCGNTCCTATQTCLGGTCCDNTQVCGIAGSVVCCGTGNQCINGVCAAISTCVAGVGNTCGNYATCGGPGTTCVCQQSIEGTSVCGAFGVCSAQTCSASSQCPDGSFCIGPPPATCCTNTNGLGLCVPLCPQACTGTGQGTCPPGDTCLPSGCCPSENVCGTVCGCTGGQICIGGTCTCPTGTFLCNGDCVPTTSSICGTKAAPTCCAGTNVCTNTVCCPTGQFGCPGATTHATAGCCNAGYTCVDTAGGNVCVSQTTCTAVDGNCSDKNFGSCDDGCQQTYCTFPNGTECGAGTCNAISCQSDADCPAGFAGSCVTGTCTQGFCTGRTTGPFAGCDFGTCGCFIVGETTDEGGPLCMADNNCEFGTCTTSSDCPAGFACIVESCCGSAGHCFAICPGVPKPSKKPYGGTPKSRR